MANAPAPALFKKLLRLSPSARRESIYRWRTAQLGKLLREQHFSAPEVVHRARDPIGVKVTVRADAVHNLLDSKYVGYISIKAISGRHRRAVQSTRVIREQRLYSVRA